MKNMKRYLQAAATMILAAGATMLTGCGDDDPVIPPDYGESSVTFLHANPGRPDNVGFYRNDSILIGSLVDYGTSFSETTPNGPSVKYTVKHASGTPLRSTTGVQDTSKRTMVLYTGDPSTDEAFFASSTRGSVGTGAAVRFIHAAKGAGPRDLKIGEPAGGAVASNLAYKSSNGAYVSVAAETDTLWIVDPTNAANNMAVPVDLMPGQGYSVVFIGSEGAIDPELGWKALIITDPN